MANSTGNQLARSVRRRIDELKGVCEGLDESAASRAPEGRWSPKEILSHLWGREEADYLQILQACLAMEKPLIEIEPEKSFYSDNRARMTFSQLLSKVVQEYNQIAEFAEILSEEQLNRKTHVPMLKESPLGEHPTLEQMVSALGDFHFKSHIDHLREVLKKV